MIDIQELYSCQPGLKMWFSTFFKISSFMVHRRVESKQV